MARLGPVSYTHLDVYKRQGVNIIGMTRGQSTKLLHTEKLDKGEVMIAQFTENTSAIKIRGRAEILTRYGKLPSGTEA